MYKIEKSSELSMISREIRNVQKRTIGFVPTMGALHEGHLSLIRFSKEKSDFTIASIFVNPTQFNNPEDYTHYPRQLEMDIQLLEEAGCDLVFLPTYDEIYPEGTSRLPHYELGYLETIMEGKHRPEHFQGVCQVVHRLLSIVEPDYLFLGEKDLQQCKVIEHLIKLTGLEDKMRLIICPTLREQDGLAMSSRNLRLTPEQRKSAPLLFKALSELKAGFGAADYPKLKANLLNHLQQHSFEVHYLELANSDTLEILNGWNLQVSNTACIAATIGKVRLIDNIRLFSKGE
ncbi:MAG: pantoate--beta-alanine ligase [Bacteroidetes bacterium]|nr:pantoate--beta-alanine ligase [Bacteroidota bacterium]